MDLILFLVLIQVKHWYVDFVLQTDAQVKSKGIYGNLVGLGHSLEHMLGTLIVSLVCFWQEPALVLLMSVLDLVIHYHTDFVKMKFGERDITKAKFWNQLGLDQMVHQLTYVVIFLVLTYYS